MVSIGTLCASSFMESKEKIELFNLVLLKYEKTKNYEIQEIFLWVLNILIKDPKVRTIKTHLQLIESKKCGWICLPQVKQLQFELYSRKERIEEKIKEMKTLIPKKPLSW